MRLFLSMLTLSILFGGGDAVAQTKHRAPPITTKSGVYSVQQAVRGRDVYAGYCKSCHTAQTHTGAAFNATWNGRALSELYEYINERMPKNEPGSLSPQEYADVLAYVLRINAMPAGERELPVESTAMQTIRIDLTKISVRKDP